MLYGRKLPNRPQLGAELLSELRKPQLPVVLTPAARIFFISWFIQPSVLPLYFPSVTAKHGHWLPYLPLAMFASPAFFTPHAANIAAPLVGPEVGMVVGADVGVLVTTAFAADAKSVQSAARIAMS